MRQSKWALVISAGLAIALPCTASAETIFEVEHARSTARVGGPVSARDAELLERWGAHSGTPEWRRPAHGERTEMPPKRLLKRGRPRRE